MWILLVIYELKLFLNLLFFSVVVLSLYIHMLLFYYVEDTHKKNKNVVNNLKIDVIKSSHHAYHAV